MNISPLSNNTNFGKSNLPVSQGGKLPISQNGKSPISSSRVIDIDYVELPRIDSVTVDDVMRSQKHTSRHKGLKALGIGLAAGLVALGALFGAYKLGTMTNNDSKEHTLSSGIEETYNPSSDEVQEEDDISSKGVDDTTEVEEIENDSKKGAASLSGEDVEDYGKETAISLSGEDVEDYGKEAAIAAMEAGEIPLTSKVGSHKEFEKWLVPHLQGNDTTSEFADIYDNTDDMGNTINNPGYERAFTNLAKGMIKQYSEDGDNYMSFDEMKTREKTLLEAVYGDNYDGTMDEARLGDMFNILDANKDGDLSSKELATYLSFLDMGQGYNKNGAEIGKAGSKNNFDGKIKNHENPKGFYLLSQYNTEPSGKNLDENFIMGNGFE